jgi:hypothetical protein
MAIKSLVAPDLLSGRIPQYEFSVNGPSDKLKTIREMFWSGRPDLNRGPPAPKTRALVRAKSYHATVTLKIKRLAFTTGCVRLCLDVLT